MLIIIITVWNLSCKYISKEDKMTDTPRKRMLLLLSREFKINKAAPISSDLNKRMEEGYLPYEPNITHKQRKSMD